MLTGINKDESRNRSSIRSHVEHIFSVQKNHMSLFIRTIAIPRAYVKVCLANIVYNMKRLIFLESRRIILQ